MGRTMQFSLKSVFAIITITAVVLAEAIGLPEEVAEIFGLVVTSLMPPACVSGIVYDRGAVRAFCIGAGAWWVGLTWLLEYSSMIGPNFDMYDNRRLDFCWFWLLTGIAGLIAVVVRRLTLDKAGNDPPRSGERV